MRAGEGVKWGRVGRVKIAGGHPTNRAGVPEGIADAVYLVNAGWAGHCRRWGCSGGGGMMGSGKS